MQRAAQTRRDSRRGIETFPARRGFRPTNQDVSNAHARDALPRVRCRPTIRKEQASSRMHVVSIFWFTSGIFSIIETQDEL